MAFLFGSASSKQSAAPDAHSTFHGDESLRDSRPAARSWFQILGSDVPSALRLVARKFSAQAAVDECARLPLDDPMSKFLTTQSVNTLWGSLLHPPLSYLGGKMQYRTADGSLNNFLFDKLGKAGEPYAKSVPTLTAPPGARPDPGDLFDLLMSPQGTDKRTTSSLGLSQMLLYHATIIIHGQSQTRRPPVPQLTWSILDIFRTNNDDKNISDTSSYLDLTPLYGRNLETQLTVRTMKNGLLKPDSFAEERLLHQPPGVCIYLIMYSRFHNYVAEQLLAINETGRFSLPPRAVFDDMSAKEQQLATAKLDDDLFQTARLITCGLYINISIHDYLRVLMRLHAQDTPWTLDPRNEISERNNKEATKRGVGNQVSCEFNLLYRFHSPISNRDAKWTEDAFRKMFEPYVDEKDFTSEQLHDLDVPIDFMRKVIDMQHKRVEKSEDREIKAPPKWLPAGLGTPPFDKKTQKYGDFPFKRDPNTGKFDDDQLVAEMVHVLNDPICHFGPRNTPKAFRAIEIMGILQARKWEVATLNEFREFFGLPKHTRFEDINGDEEIQDALRDLYGDPDLVELYPGLFCEGGGDYDPKTRTSSKLDPGATCPNNRGTALWRGVFSDAITLVRSDRFYTIDWNVASLTAWGMREVTSDPDILKGSVFHRLWQRAFPGYFKYNSVLLWQPFYTPVMNLKLAAKQSNYLELLDEKTDDLETNAAKDPDFVPTLKPAKHPRKRPAAVSISDYQTIYDIVNGEKSKNFVNHGVLQMETIRAEALKEVFKNASVGDTSGVLGKLVQEKEQALFFDYFFDMSRTIANRERRQMQKRKVAKEYVYQIDIIKDYAIPVITRFMADFLGFGQDIKTAECLNRKYDENQIYKHFTNCQDFLTFNPDETTAWKRRADFTKSLHFLKETTERCVDAAQPGIFGDFWGGPSYGSAQDGEAVKSLRKLGADLARYLVKEKRKTTEEAAAILLFTAIDATFKSILVFASVLSYFLDQNNVKHWRAIQGLANQTVKTDLEKKAVNDQITKYVLEAQRINADVWVLRTLNEGATTMPLKCDEPDGKAKERAPSEGEILVLKVKAASQNPKVFPNPSELKLNRDPRTYIYYGRDAGAPFDASQLTIVAITGMIKYAAKLSYLRQAHDTAGRLKTAATPDGLWGERYLSPQWDQLLPFPTTWNLRFDGPNEGAGVYDGPDNSRTGNGVNQLFSLDKLSAGETLTSSIGEAEHLANGTANGAAK